MLRALVNDIHVQGKKMASFHESLSEFHEIPKMEMRFRRLDATRRMLLWMVRAMLPRIRFID